MAGEFVSGTEILSNPGNAALGYSSGVGYNANPADTNPFGTIQSTLSALQAQDAQRRESMRQQGIQEQKELADYLIGTGKSAFNLPGPDGQSMGFNPLEEDRQVLNEAADDLRRSIMANPTKWKFDPEIQKKVADFKQLTTHASIRSVDVANKLAKAAAMNNPEERDRIMQSVESTRKTGVRDFRSPEPYLPQETFSVEKFYSPDIISGKNKEAWQTFGSTATVDQSGNEVQVDTVGLSDNVLDFRPRMKRGGADYDQAVNLVRSFYASPASKDVNAIADMNERIDRINAQRGYTEKSPHFIPHITTPLPGGQLQYNNLPVEDMAYALMAEKYGNFTQQQQVKRTASQINKEKQDVASEKARIKQAWERLEIDEKEARQKEKTLTAAQKRDLDETNAVKGDVLRVIDMVTPESKPPLAMNALPAEMRSNVASELGITEKGLENYVIKTLPINDVGVRHLAGVRYKNPNGDLGVGSQKPEYVFSVTPKGKGVQDAVVVVGYREYEDVFDKNGKPKVDGNGKPEKKKIVSVKSMTLPDAIKSYIDASGGFKNPTGRIDKAHAYMEEYFSGRNPEDLVKFNYDESSVNSILEANKDKNFVKRYLDPDKYPVIKNSDGSVSTHLMASSDNIVFPMIVQDKNGKLKKFDDWKDAYKYAMNSGEYIKMPDEKSAKWMAENGYKEGDQTKASTEGVPDAVKKLAPQGAKVESFVKEKNGVKMNIYRIGTKYYYANGQQIM